VHVEAIPVQTLEASSANPALTATAVVATVLASALGEAFALSIHAVFTVATGAVGKAGPAVLAVVAGPVSTRVGHLRGYCLPIGFCCCLGRTSVLSRVG